MSENGKIDKRTREYKQIVKNQQETTEVISQEDDRVEKLEGRLDEMAEMLRKVVQITKDTAKQTTEIKSKDYNKLLNKQVEKDAGRVKNRAVKIPREEEYKVLVAFCGRHAPAVSLNKKLCEDIGVCLHIYKNVEATLVQIRNDDYLRQKAIEENLTVDFKTVAIPDNKKKIQYTD